MQALATRLGLSKSKIYKWNWDRKKKELGMMGGHEDRMSMGKMNDGKSPPFMDEFSDSKNDDQPIENSMSDDSRNDSLDDIDLSE